MLSLLINFNRNPTQKRMAQKKDIETIYPQNPLQWREWLEKNHLDTDAVWVIFYKKESGQPTLSWSESVDEALCFGWIDSLKKKLDDERSVQFFSKRKPKSTWSKINKEKIERLNDAGLMKPAGMECVRVAKENGSWTLLDEVDALVIPPDLEEAFGVYEGSKEYFRVLSQSDKKVLLQWVVLAKTEATRKQRILQIAANAGNHEKPETFRPKPKDIH